MFITVIFNLLIFIEISHQKLLVKILDDNSEGSTMDSKLLIPSYFLKPEDIPSNLTFQESLSSITCFNRINHSTTKELKKFLSLEIDDLLHTYSLNTDTSCLEAPKSTKKFCPMDDIYKSIKILEIEGDVFLFSTGGFFGVITLKEFKGGFIYRKENYELTKEEYMPMLQYFGFEGSINVSDYNLSLCVELCSPFLDDLIKTASNA